VRQLVTESVLLAMLGGAAGIALTIGSMESLRTFAAASLPRAGHIDVDPRVLLFACAATLITGVLAGLVPALQASRLDVQRGLKVTSHSLMSGSSVPRNALIIAQLALSIVLVAAAGLMLRTLDRLSRIDLGFTPERILTVQVAPRANPEAFFATLLERVARLPKVDAVGATSGAPMTSGNTSLNVFPVGWAAIPEAKSVQADWRIVSQDYFRAMEVSLLKGRVFTPHDDEAAPKVIIVNRSLAKMLWGDGDPLGRQVNPGGGTSYSTVIGVVDDVRSHNPAVPPAPSYYMSAYRGVWGPMTLVIRTSADAHQLVPLIRTEVKALDPTLPVYQIRTMDDLVRERIAPQRLMASLLAIFASLALLLTVVGIYGVIAYATVQRTREVGIRLALGAQHLHVLGPLVREGAMLIGGGAALGIAIALPVTQLMRGLLTDVSPADPLTFAATTALLTVASLVACYVPARRALRVDPVVALRAE
jgi:predicted permease